jgi:uridylate kinase
MTAFTLCKENNLPIIVFDMNTEGNLERLMAGESLGTLVTMAPGTDRHHEPSAAASLLDPTHASIQPLVGNQPEQA